jgi:hypothetical protein
MLQTPTSKSPELLVLLAKYPLGCRDEIHDGKRVHEQAQEAAKRLSSGAFTVLENMLRRPSLYL